MKIKFFASLILIAPVILAFCALPKLYAEDNSAEAKLEALRAVHQESQQVGENTLAAPLISAAASASITTTGLAPTPVEIRSEVESLLRDSTQIGVRGNLVYDQAEGQGVRVHVAREAKESSLFFSFDGSKDLRDRWVRVRYSGLAVPEFLTVRFDADELRRDSDFRIYLENSVQSREVFFKLPGKTSFADIHSLSFVFDPGEKLLGADFTIEGLDVLAASQEPVTR
ncbi:MAG: hypothetical protein HYZ84_06965 [Candidatus Omnitrophica bacterium]|nr:hypothetical protein [Candidatus Omnitrophota bacterium]